MGDDAAHAVADAGQGGQGVLAVGAARFLFVFGKGEEKEGFGGLADGFGEGLHEGEVGVQGARGVLFVAELAVVGLEFVRQYDAGGVAGEEGGEDVAARRCAAVVGWADGVVGLGAAYAVGEFAP